MKNKFKKWVSCILTICILLTTMGVSPMLTAEGSDLIGMENISGGDAGNDLTFSEETNKIPEERDVSGGDVGKSDVSGSDAGEEIPPKEGPSVDVSGGDAVGKDESEDEETLILSVRDEEGDEGDYYARKTTRKNLDILNIPSLGRSGTGFSYHYLDGHTAFCMQYGAGAGTGQLFRRLETEPVLDVKKAVIWYETISAKDQMAYICAQVWIWVGGNEGNFLNTVFDVLLAFRGFDYEYIQAMPFTQKELVLSMDGISSGDINKYRSQISGTNASGYTVYVFYYDSVTQPFATMYPGKWIPVDDPGLETPGAIYGEVSATESATATRTQSVSINTKYADITGEQLVGAVFGVYEDGVLKGTITTDREGKGSISWTVAGSWTSTVTAFYAANYDELDEDTKAGLGDDVYHSEAEARATAESEARMEARAMADSLANAQHSYTIKEITVPHGFLITQDSEQSFTLSGEATHAVSVVNQPWKARVALDKTDSISGNRIAGDASFDIYEWAGTEYVLSTTYRVVRLEDGTYTVQGNKQGMEQGYVYYTQQNEGKFYIKETGAPEGYLLDDSPMEFEMTADGQMFSFTHKNQHVHGEVFLYKYDDEAEGDFAEGSRITQGDGSLEGAVYGLYAAEDITHPDGVTGVLYHAGDLVDEGIIGLTPVTDKDGYLLDENGERCFESGKDSSFEKTPGSTAFRQVELGKYYIREVTPSKGYLPDNTDHRGTEAARYNVTFTYEDETKAVVLRDQMAKDDDNNLTMDDEDISHNVYSGDFVGKQAARFVKLDDFENDSEGRPLEGAGFSIYLLNSLSRVMNGEIMPLNGETWTRADMERQIFGSYDFSKEQTAIVYKRQSETWTEGDTRWLEATGEHANEYRVKEMFTDVEGCFVTPELPYGQYILIETTVPKGKVMADPMLVEITVDSKDAQRTRYIEDESIQTYIRLQKEDTDPFSEQYATVLKEGAAYRIRLLSNEKDFQMDNDNKAWELDGDGYLSYKDAVNPGVRTGTAEAPFTVQFIYGAQGKIADAYIELAYRLPIGTYELLEVKAPEGYVLNGIEKSLKDTTDETGHNSYEITDTPMDSVMFEITDEAVYPDGQMGSNKYINTDEYGNLIITIFQKNRQQKGIFEITKYGEQLAEARALGKSLADKLPKYGDVDYVFRKICLEEEYHAKDYVFVYEYAPVKDAVFGIFAAEDIYSQQLDQEKLPDYADDINRYPIWEKDIMLAEITTDLYGYAYLADLPIGKYYVKELTAGDGFVLSDRVEYFEITSAEQTVSFIWEGTEYINDRQKVEVSAEKRDADTMEPIAGAIFGLYNKESIYTYIAEGSVEDIPYYRLNSGNYPGYNNGDNIYQYLYDAMKNGNSKCWRPGEEKLLVKENTLIATAITGEDGRAVFDVDLPLGEYYIVEMEAPEGYTNMTVSSGSNRGKTDDRVNVDATYAGDFGGQHVKIQIHDADTETLSFVNQITKHMFVKSDITTGELLDGALLQVLEIVTDVSGIPMKDKSGGYVTALIEEWVSDKDEVHYFYEDEKGYYLELEDPKKLPSGKELIIKMGHLIEGLKEGRQYILREVQAPEGYVGYDQSDEAIRETNREENLVTEEVRFTIKDSNIVAEHEMKDDYTKVEIDKLSLVDGKPVEGAKLTIFDAEGKVYDSWITGKESHYIERMPVGKYTLTEELAPDGYVQAEEVSFEVLETGEIQKVVMYDDIQKVSVEKVDSRTGASLVGAKLQLLKVTDTVGNDVSGGDVFGEDTFGGDISGGNVFGSDAAADDAAEVELEIVETWVTNGTPYDFPNLEPGEYILREIQAPDGYYLAEDIHFIVTGEETKVIRIRMKDEKIPDKPDKPDKPDEPKGEDVPGDGGGATGDNALIVIAGVLAFATAISLAYIRFNRKRKNGTKTA